MILKFCSPGKEATEGSLGGFPGCLARCIGKGGGTRCRGLGPGARSLRNGSFLRWGRARGFRCWAQLTEQKETADPQGEGQGPEDRSGGAAPAPRARWFWFGLGPRKSDGRRPYGILRGRALSH